MRLKYLHTIVKRLHGLTQGRGTATLSDGLLLERFARHQDEAAFATLLERHGPMLLAVCRRLLPNWADADDAFQATFLVLASRPGAIRRRESVASWLHGVARRVAHRARQRDSCRRQVALPADLPAANEEDPARALDRQDLRTVLDKELAQLPPKYLAPLVLCYLEGQTNAEAAAQLGLPLGTVQNRLFRARERLRCRLIRRGITISAALLGASLAPHASAAVPAALAENTLQTAFLFAAGRAASASSAGAVALSQGVLRTMLLSSVQRAAVILLALAVLGIAVGLGVRQVLAGGEAPIAEGTPPLAAALPEPNELAEPKEKRDRPRVIRVSPADDASEVNPITEIRIRFDQPMDPANALLSWITREPIGFRPRGEMRYVQESHEFVLSVRLTPGSRHMLIVNRVDAASSEGLDEGFRSTQGRTAKAYTWSFRTVTAAAEDGKGPRPIVIEPPPDSEVSLITPLQVTFDQPMDPDAYGLAAPEPTTQGHRPELLSRPEYDPDQHRFTLLTLLPPNWNGEVRLERFRTRGGIPARPMTLKYRTLRSLESESLQKHLAQAGQSRQLLSLIERVRKARRDLRRISERVAWAMAWGSESSEWYSVYHGWGAHFAKQGGRKFIGEFDSGRMHFRVGSDGTSCWYRYRNEQTLLPAKEVHEQNVLICDPFDAAGKDDAARIIAREKLEYLGEATVRGRRCHRVRSWAVYFISADWISPIRDWYIDADTLLPLRIEAAGNGLQVFDYTHSRISETIPDEEFHPVAEAGVRATPPEPLTDGYTQRFLTVNDGSSGRMSVRWGIKGPKGAKSGGLN